MRKWLWLSALVVAFDQVSKRVASELLTLYIPVAVMPSVNLTLAHNSGAAFSFLSEAGGWQRWFLLSITVVICVFLYHWLKQLDSGESVSSAAISLIIGGAIGNALDRLVYGYVVDFIDVYYGKYHWPVFNLADMTITVGALGLILAAVTGRQDQRGRNR